ncbi:phosphopantetheine-binding protein [Streptomyces syringium]|uniref:Acyl carrier protein n=1 Tax=Streptomyces syringium TaxID=76729 RepID=A0ABS4YDB6_9ACTN|nr:phosphopantetheine-binding protein [Streptomyces syringium]MBP2406520.1 acyl carrier protein [Streptomyces syringium]
MADSPTDTALSRLLEVLDERFDIPSSSLTPHTSVSTLGLDSLELVELAVIMDIDIDRIPATADITLGELVEGALADHCPSRGSEDTTR